MQPQRHHVTGFFAERGQAQDTYDRLIAQGIASQHMAVYPGETPAPDAAAATDDSTMLEKIIVDAGIGTVAGSVLGGLAEIALVAANVSLIISSPLIAPLVMLGWGASIGGLIGVAKGVLDKPDPEPPGGLSALIRDATAAGQVVLVVQTHSDEETTLARKTMQDGALSSWNGPDCGTPIAGPLH